jgi:hypothetical protein
MIRMNTSGWPWESFGVTKLFVEPGVWQTWATNEIDNIWSSIPLISSLKSRGLIDIIEPLVGVTIGDERNDDHRISMSR